MTSKLAKSQIELWQKEGLAPTFEDIIKLNDVGLKVERGSDMYSFAACPRLAFLGDVVLREPTIAKRIWMDEVQRLFADGIETRLYLVAWSLAADDNNLPSLNDKKKIGELVVEFRDKVLLKCTETQILAALDYVLNGDKVQYDELDEESKKKLDEVYDVPTEDQSLAKQLLLAALTYKIPAEVADYALLDDLQNMLLVAAMQNGADNTVKNEHTKFAGQFYMMAGKIHERLVKEKEEKKA